MPQQKARQRRGRPFALLALCLAGTVFRSATAASGLYLTTDGGKIVDQTGKEVVLKGFALSGIEIGHTMSGDLSKGTNSIAQDWRTLVYRQKLMGFNAVRIEWSWTGLAKTPINFNQPACRIATSADIQASATPPATAPTVAAQQGAVLPFAPPSIGNGGCSADLPNDSTLNRVAYMTNYYCSQGFYVSLVYHGFQIQYGGDPSVLDLNGWVAKWVVMLKAVLQYGNACQGRLILDVMNEADAYNGKWDAPSDLPTGVSDYYLAAMDAMYPLCKTCLFLVQGTGQYLAPVNANFGDGFSTDPAVAGSSTPVNFFTTLLTKPYLNQVALAPHVYGPTVTSATSGYQGADLWYRLTASFGTLNKAGFCAGTNCHVFAVVLGEFNFAPAKAVDQSFFASLAQYMMLSGAADDKKHNPVKSFFIWAWDADADDTFGSGGLVASDWTSLNWEKLGALIGNSTKYPTSLGLTPWYLDGYTTATPFNMTTGNPLSGPSNSTTAGSTSGALHAATTSVLLAAISVLVAALAL